jgi:membrane-anchored protein YejM (alkaline phosphatase superfamily)
VSSSGDCRSRRNQCWQLYYIMLYTLPWSTFELATSVVIGTNYITWVVVNPTTIHSIHLDFVLLTYFNRFKFPTLYLNIARTVVVVIVW